MIPPSEISQVSRIALPRHIQGALDYISVEAGYKLWLHTNDFILGTYLELYPSGKVIRVTIREDEGDQRVLVRPAT